MDKFKEIEKSDIKGKGDGHIKKEISLINKEMGKLREEAVKIERGIESCIDGRRIFKKIYAALFVIGLVVSITSLINGEWILFLCAICLKFLSLLLYKKGKKMDMNKKFNIYLIIWVFWFFIAIISIWRSKNILSIISFVMMLAFSIVANVSSRKMKMEMVNAEIKKMQKKLRRYETNFDRLLIILGKYKSVKISVFAKAFHTDRQQIEEWAEILENHKLLEINYPFFGEPELRLIQKNKKEAEEE